MTDFTGPTWWSETRPAHPFTELDRRDFDRLFLPRALVIHAARQGSAYTYDDRTKASRCKPTDIEQQWSLIKACHLLCIEAGIQFDIVLRARPDAELMRFEPALPVETEIVCTYKPDRHCCDAVFYGTPTAMGKAVAFADQFPECICWRAESQLSSEYLFAEHCRRVGLTVRTSKEILAVNLLRTSGERVALTG
jgi:hypothetical protein